MTMVRVGFAGGTTVIDRAIQKVSGGDYVDITHAFIFLLDSIAEAEGSRSTTISIPVSGCTRRTSTAAIRM